MDNKNCLNCFNFITQRGDKYCKMEAISGNDYKINEGIESTKTCDQWEEITKYDEDRGGMVSSMHSVDIAKERLEAGYLVTFTQKAEPEVSDG